MGLKGFRQVVAQLANNAEDAIEQMAKTLSPSQVGLTDLLHRELMSINGWSAYVQYQVREKSMQGESDGSLQDLLAIRLAYDVAVYRQFVDQAFQPIWTNQLGALSRKQSGLGANAQVRSYIWQLAYEHAYQRQLIGNLQKASATPVATEKARPDVQAVFCIDVRSEVLRRSFEATSPHVETMGFAGFFGFPIEMVSFGQKQGTAQCPVLLTPKFQVHETVKGASPAQQSTLLQQKVLSRRLGQSWKSFKTSAVSCFSFVETAGLLSGIKLVKQSWQLNHAAKPDANLAPSTAPAHVCGENHGGIDVENQIQLATGALRNMGMTSNFARLVMLCGHGSQTANNPYAAGLDCGACGGHTGEANARIAAAVLNNPAVWACLQAQGIEVPADTWFLAALDNTTTDDVTIFDTELVPATHSEDRKNLQAWLATASHQTRLQRAPKLGLKDVTAAEIDAQVRARSEDWAQTRPEWGLAANAAFIAAPHERTKSLNLGGRTFLHNYDYQQDNEGAVLELIMVAPMVVASWINLQYFGSTVNNAQFGSGNKVLHNVVGTMGIHQGNGGDLQPGLALQSLHNGEQWMHEPLRLSVFIEAPRHMIDAVIEKHEGVRDLVDNGWLHLIAVEDEGRNYFRYCGDLHWKSIGDARVPAHLAA
jgi:uncharacterized protein YbcC (UPF0753/DUF2309 family)